jgi:hypothetical protein
LPTYPFERKRYRVEPADLGETDNPLPPNVASGLTEHPTGTQNTQLLPELKTRGKTVLVINQDDKYFHLADRFKTIAGRLRSLTTV